MPFRQCRFQAAAGTFGAESDLSKLRAPTCGTGCDVILVNADGRVVEKGNHDELMAMKGVRLCLRHLV